MKNRELIYWLCQIIGWGLFVLGNILSAPFVGSDLNQVVKLSIMIFLMGIGITHLFRILVHRWGWKKSNNWLLVPRVLIASIVMGFFLVSFNTAITDLINGDSLDLTSFFRAKFLLNVINFSVLFLLWCLIYFAVSILQNWRKEEIQNLELKAAKTEVELNSFKAQMNPHFMFNSLNSIRALVDENPSNAKNAITMLSSIMRNNLLFGKRQTVTIKEELDLVENYLSIEKIRFEERLNISMDIDSNTLSYEIPPFMLQTLVENGVKHGVSKIIEGGEIRLSCQLMGDVVQIEIVNSGKFEQDINHTGFGISNTKKRLELLYDGEAFFNIENTSKGVRTTLELPLNKK
ncbi:MAG: histidine kinase [Flavobacteriales bacterium]